MKLVPRIENKPLNTVTLAKDGLLKKKFFRFFSAYYTYSKDCQIILLNSHLRNLFKNKTAHNRLQRWTLNDQDQFRNVGEFKVFLKNFDKSIFCFDFLNFSNATKSNIISRKSNKTDLKIQKIIFLLNELLKYLYKNLRRILKIYKKIFDENKLLKEIKLIKSIKYKIEIINNLVIS